MADEKKKEERELVFKRDIEKVLGYLVDIAFEFDISRAGHAVALKRRHEMLGDMKEDYDRYFGSEEEVYE